MEKLRGPGPGAKFAHNQDAVSEALGSVLLVGITVLTAGALGTALVHIPGPAERWYVVVDPSLSPGQGGWGTGDEQVRIIHVGGNPLPRDETRIVVTVAVPLGMTGPGLGDGFGDGQLSIGEGWDHTILLAACDEVQVQVVVNLPRGSSQLLLDSRLVGDSSSCGGG